MDMKDIEFTCGCATIDIETLEDGSVNDFSWVPCSIDHTFGKPDYFSHFLVSRVADLRAQSEVVSASHRGYLRAVGAHHREEADDLRAALKTAQDHGEELTKTIKERNTTIADMHAAFETMEDTGGC